MRRRRYSFLERIPGQVNHMRDLVEVSDEDCKKMLQMDRNAFLRLCNLLHTSGQLKKSKYVTIQEKVAMFLSILSHHTKNWSGCLGALDGTYIDVQVPTSEKARYRNRKGTSHS
ncbi:hypothetical protein ACS0TY_012101 [Phlomoides rotata]